MMRGCNNTTRRLSGFLAVSLLALFACAAIARADKLVLQDGSAIECDVVAEDESSLTIEQSSPINGVTVSRTLDRARVQTWYRAPRDGPAYVVVPIVGAIGQDVPAAAVRAGMAEARRVKPAFVVLAIDSPGGDVRQMFEMLDAIWQSGDQFQIVAYVKNAYSAAAVVAMSCPRIYIKPGGAIGAAVPFRMTENGPVEVEAKLRGVIEAGMRAANAHGGHNDLLMRAMTEMDLELYLTDENGKPKLTNTPAGRLIKSKGEILTLTDTEATAVGLASTAGDMAEVGKQAAGGAWHEGSRRPWRAVTAIAQSQQRVARQEEEKKQRAAARLAALVVLRPVLDGNVRRVAELEAHRAATEKALSDTTARANEKIQQVRAEYDQAIRRANANRVAARQAREVAEAKSAEIQRSYEDTRAKLQSQIDAAEMEANMIRQRQKELLASLPPE